MHITPLKLSGKIIDIFMLLEHEMVDHILIGLLQIHEEKLMAMEHAAMVMDYFKNQLMQDSLTRENIGNFINEESLHKLMML
jgi:hypothetical protein